MLSIYQYCVCFALFLFPASTNNTLETTLLDHEFHISKCLIEFNEKEKALQFTLHLFIDDLEEALRQQGADKLYICTEKEVDEAEAYIYKYLQQKLAISLEGEQVDYTFIGKEMSEDMVAVWCYLEIENVENIRELHVKNSILLEAFDDQKNIISITGPNKKKGYLLFNNAKNEETIEF